MLASGPTNSRHGLFGWPAASFSRGLSNCGFFCDGFFLAGLPRFLATAFFATVFLAGLPRFLATVFLAGLPRFLATVFLAAVFLAGLPRFLATVFLAAVFFLAGLPRFFLVSIVVVFFFLTTLRFLVAVFFLSGRRFFGCSGFLAYRRLFPARYLFPSHCFFLLPDQSPILPRLNTDTCGGTTAASLSDAYSIPSSIIT